jgi:hypothetical protein
MKKLVIAFLFLVRVAHAQTDEAKQLLLNVEKLAQFKSILKNMKDGYQLIHKGYTAVKDISQGNFKLHATFLDGLLQVSPLVKKYKRVADVIDYQVRLIREYKDAWKQFKADRQFTVSEIEYIGKVYASLIERSFQTVDELAMIITAGKLRMSDDERLTAIDRLYEEVVDQYTFLNDFNDGTAMLSIQREKARMDIDLMKKVHGLH